MFEDFAKAAVPIDHNGKKFALYGTCDGIMTYISEDGEQLRVGLEVKSKQTSNAMTSEFSQRNGPSDDHVKQTVCYSIMYGSDGAPIDYYVILYVNGSKKSWNMSPDEYAKNPDIAVHCFEITDDMRAEVLDNFAGIVDAVERVEAPPLDLANWTFNNFKRACAASLSDEEYAAIERQVDAVQRSGMKDFVKRNYTDAFDDIKRLRGAAV